MILDISIDPKTKEVTVEGDPKHKLGTRGGGMIHWRCEPKQGHLGWTVKFDDGKPSPFTKGEKEFGSSGRPDGGRLATRTKKDGDGHFEYVVSCTDSHGDTYGTDPEIIVWPT